ncbi:MAG: tetratricopeptide repeat protein, partial [Candidatus Binatia bacterium]
MRTLATIATLMVLAVSLALPAYAQEALWNDLNAKVFSLYQQGRYSEAAKVAKESLKVAENTFGLQHPAVATSLNNLAEIYRVQGRYAAAEPLYKRALAIREKALGPDHPAVATSLNNLAEIYRVQ